MTDTEAPKLIQFAREACSSTNGIEDAIEVMERAVKRAKPADRKALEREALAWACREAIYDVRYSERNSIKKAAACVPGHCKRGPGALSAVTEPIVSAMLDTWKIGDAALGDIKGFDLLPEAAKHEQQAKGYMNIARLYRTLAELAGDKPVRAAVDNAKCADIWREIEGKQVKRRAAAKTSQNARATVPLPA